MILKELLERSEYTLVQGSEDVEISTLVYDSRKIEKGSVFVYISGAAFDGHKFVAQAAELGAAAVVVEKDVEVPDSYVSNINKIVANRINMSKLIIENNYYAKIDYKE